MLGSQGRFQSCWYLWEESLISKKSKNWIFSQTLRSLNNCEPLISFLWMIITCIHILTSFSFFSNNLYVTWLTITAYFNIWSNVWGVLEDTISHPPPKKALQSNGQGYVIFLEGDRLKNWESRIKNNNTIYHISNYLLVICAISLCLKQYCTFFFNWYFVLLELNSPNIKVTVWEWIIQRQLVHSQCRATTLSV